jgi:hypothetical protein
MFIDPILLVWSKSLDVKLLRNKFQKQLTYVVSHFTNSLNFQVVNSNLKSSTLKI